MRLPARMMPHRELVSYKPKVGEGAYGPVYGPEVVCERALIDDKRKLVRARDSREVVAEARVALDYPDHDVPEGSLVTIWRGTARQRESKVIVVSLADFPRLPRFTELALE